ncbi:MAG: hypothetical protein ACT4PU_04370 [Planctomycetota bacterium]
MAAGSVSAQPASTATSLDPWSGFVEVEGAFLTRVPGAWLRITNAGIDVLPQSAEGFEVPLALRFDNQVRVRSLHGDAPLPGLVHLLLGDDSTKHRTGLRRYAELRARDSTGTTVFRIHRGPAGLVLTRAPGAAAPFAQPTRVDTPSGTLRLSAPGDAAQDSESNYGIDWATIISGVPGETGNALAVHSSGDLLIGGMTIGGLPVTDGAFDETFTVGTGSLGNTHDSWLARLSADGSALVWATYFGGTNNEEIFRIVAEPDGSVLAAGHVATFATDVPVAPGSTLLMSGGFDAFVARLSSEGSTLLATAFLGGTKSDEPRGLALTPTGSVVVSGWTTSPDFPVTPNAAQPHLASATNSDSFLARLSPALDSIEYATYWGGTGGDSATGVAVSADGYMAIVGATGTADFPVHYAGSDGQHAGKADAFVACFDPQGALIFSRHIGGSDIDWARDVIYDSAGRIVLCGDTFWPGIPATPGLFDSTHNNWEDAFVARLDPLTGETLGLTYVGDHFRDWGWRLADAGSGAIVLSGETTSSVFPTTEGAVKPALGNGSKDLFVARLSPDMRSLHYATYYGGSDFEGFFEHGLAVLDDGAVALCDYTSSPDFPTTEGAFQEDLQGGAAAAIIQFSMLPTGVRRYGASTPGPLGHIALGVNSMPQPGDEDFAVVAFRAPPESTGWLILGASDLSAPVAAKGIGLWVDPASLLGMLPWTSDLFGYAQIRLAVPRNPLLVGLRAFAQGLWPTGDGSLVSSNALDITVQP